VVHGAFLPLEKEPVDAIKERIPELAAMDPTAFDRCLDVCFNLASLFFSDHTRSPPIEVTVDQLKAFHDTASAERTATCAALADLPGRCVFRALVELQHDRAEVFDRRTDRQAEPTFQGVAWANWLHSEMRRLHKSDFAQELFDALVRFNEQLFANSPSYIRYQRFLRMQEALEEQERLDLEEIEKQNDTRRATPAHGGGRGRSAYSPFGMGGGTPPTGDSLIGSADVLVNDVSAKEMETLVRNHPVLDPRMSAEELKANDGYLLDLHAAKVLEFCDDKSAAVVADPVFYLLILAKSVASRSELYTALSQAKKLLLQEKDLEKRLDGVKAQFLIYRLTLSGLTMDEAENIDRAWIRSLRWMNDGDTMRSLLQRISIHNALLSWYWSDSQLKKVLGDSLTSYMEAAPMGIISLLKKDHPNPVSQRYSYLLARENWTWPELQAKFALEPLVFATPSPKKATSFPSDRQHAPDVPGDDHGDSDGNVPLYYQNQNQSGGRPTGRGSISSDVVVALEPAVHELKQMISANTDALKLECKQIYSQLDNLKHEHDILRTCMNTREANPGTSFEQAIQQARPHDAGAPQQQDGSPATAPTPKSAKPSASAAPPAQSRDRVQIAMEQAMQAAVGTGRANYSRGRDPEAERKARVEARADVEFDKLPEPWDRCVGLLETVKNAKKDDPNAPCVICSRKGADGKYGFGPNGFPHPTRKCGFLWTLTPKGLEWLRQRQGPRSAAQQFAEAASHDIDEIDAALCAVCHTSDVEKAAMFMVTASEAAWESQFTMFCVEAMSSLSKAGRESPV
jgi:hypothetical protein